MGKMIVRCCFFYFKIFKIKFVGMGGGESIIILLIIDFEIMEVWGRKMSLKLLID